MSNPICSVPDCSDAVRARGWCNRHYLRWRAHGDVRTDVQAAVRRAIDHTDGTRTCTRCGLRKPLESSFHADKRASLGYRSTCKVCHTAAQMDRYNADPEKHKKRIRAQYSRDIDVIRVRDKARYERDKPKRLALAKAGVHKRRALRAQAIHESGITVEALKKRDGRKCHFCRVIMSFKPVRNGSYNPKRATLEHLTPLSKGGPHTWANVALACWQCNVRKNNSMDGDWEGSQCPTLPLC